MAESATVVIVNHNGAHLLGPCLDAVRRQNLPAGTFRTVVVDNASRDVSRELVAERYPWVHLINSPTNLGFAGGNNLALRAVTTPFAVLLNNDAVPEPDWLPHLLAPFEEPGAARLGAVTGKVVFLPRFVRLSFLTPGFRAGTHDPRELGVRVFRVLVGDRDVTDKVLWERLSYGPEGAGEGRFRWTRPAGDLLVPVQGQSGDLATEATITFTMAAERTKPVTVAGAGVVVTTDVGTEPVNIELELATGEHLVDVINNAGGIVLTNGYGADRGFQEIDEGQYDSPTEVFSACGNGIAMRTSAGRDIDWFDDAFFMYYEDTDLSWRLRARGWSIRYEPTAVLRHVHAATSKEWSPRWVFHVDRNRLLMLVKNASRPLALRQVGRYPLSTASMALRAGIEAARQRSRPAVRPHLVRVQVMVSFLRLLGPMLSRRRAIAGRALVPRAELERWLVNRR
jgi:GT2 family glycosyltransferase